MSPNSFRKKKKKYGKKIEKFGLIYDENISEILANHVYLNWCVFLSLKKKYTVKTKRINPGSLLSGQIARDLKVGDKKITKDKRVRWLILTSVKINFKHW